MMAVLHGAADGTMRSFELIVFFALMAIDCCSVSAVKCNLRSGSTCICDMDDHSGSLDLTPISKHDGSAFFKNIGGYSFNPCVPYQDNKCKTDVAVCQHSSVVCGRQTSAQFEITSTSPIKGTLAYAGGDVLGKIPRTAVITFQCDPKSPDTMKFVTEHPSLHYEFTLTSPHVCLVPPPPPPTTQPTKAPPPAQPTTQPAPPNPTTHGHSTDPKDNAISLGTILDICVLLLVVTYLSAGTSFMYFRRGARGKEALPNIEFWMAVPGFIKEGSLFIVHKVKSLRGSSGGYEKL